ncbi:MAG: substrate-binding domain-containing protein [Acidimicrobiia bacterium]|nr:substrate-binding domain-containing protein [Acidimicrobiia bacterium]
MKVSFRRLSVFSVSIVVGAALVACGGSSKKSASSTSTTSGKNVSISVTAFTSDFAAMNQLRGLAAQGKGLVGVLLPDTTTSARYVSFDAPYLTKAFQTAGFTQFKIDNAQGSASTMQTQAEADITSGASVLVVDPLDSGSGAAIENNAISKGVKVIDYDRLTKGGPPDRIYVSFDNVKVGQAIGNGFTQCVKDWNVSKPNVLVMDGDPSDNNAGLFAQGYNGVLNPLFQNGSYVKVAEPAGTWTPSVAQTTFAQQYTAHPNINSVVTPNDDNANAVIAYLQSKQIKPKTFPTTGQDASKSGLQNILKGYQCGTVYKPIYLEAQAAAAIALYMRAGQTPPSSLVNATTKDTQTNTEVKSTYLTPTWVTVGNLEDTVVKDNAVKVTDICVADTQAACTAAGIK